MSGIIFDSLCFWDKNAVGFAKYMWVTLVLSPYGTDIYPQTFKIKV